MIEKFYSLSVEAIERRGAKEGMEGGGEVVKAKNLAENKPEGPFRTKNTTAIAKIVKLLRRKCFYYAPQIYYAADPSWRGKMSVIPRKLVSAQGTPR